MIIAFEGINGCGKTTQLNKLYNWISENMSCRTQKTSWNSYPVLEDLNLKLKKEDLLSPMGSVLIHALDFNLRYEQHIHPCTESGGIVLADRYYYTAYARDTARGISPILLDEIYKNFLEPDHVFYFRIVPKKALARIKNIENRSNYILGLDLKYSDDKIDNFLHYLDYQCKKYDQMFCDNNRMVTIIDADTDEDEQFAQVLRVFNNIPNIQYGR